MVIVLVFLLQLLKFGMGRAEGELENCFFFLINW
jgi:hypothetical protein